MSDTSHETVWTHVSGRTTTDEAMHAVFEAFHDELRGPLLLGGVASDQAPQGLAG